MILVDTSIRINYLHVNGHMLLINMVGRFELTCSELTHV